MVRDIARTSRSAHGNGAIMIAYGIALSEEDADDDLLGLPSLAIETARAC
jgi:hypothetical protein